MKSNVFSILLVFMSFSLFGQQVEDKFTLTPAGFNNSVIKEYPGKTDSELYLSTKLWAERTIENTETAKTRDITDQYLEYRVFAPQAFSITDDGNTYTWDSMFDLAFRFTNGEIRYDVEIVEVSSRKAPTFSIVGGLKQWAFYSLENEPYPLTSDARKTMEEIVNDFIRGVSAFVNRDADIPDSENGQKQD